MAFDLNNSDLLLPSDQFFVPQDHHIDSLSMANSGSSSSSNSNNNPMINQNESYLFGSSDSGSSELSSPIGSELSSSSTTTASSELEEDDYIGVLSRQIAQYMLQDEDKHERPWSLSRSPESTFWSLPGSNLDSSAGPSPPLTHMIGNLEKKRINEETTKYNQDERSTGTSSSSIQTSRRNQNFGFQSKQAIIDDQIRAIQFYRLKQEEAMKQMEQKPSIKHYQSKGRVFGRFDNGQKLPLNSNNNPSWYNLQLQSNQQAAGSDLKAVFFNPSGSRNVSFGTGVFLPRGTVTPCESRKKKGCATVLIPARVVQALKHHFEKTGAPSRFNNGFPLEHDASENRKNNSMHFSQQKWLSGTVLPAMNHQDMDLPQEWTY